MNIFQITVLTLLAGAVVFDTNGLVRRRYTKRMWAVRVAAWAATAFIVAFPNTAQVAANLIGIHRGADLVLYVFVITTLFVLFYLNSRDRSLERQVAELVRRNALRESPKPSRHVEKVSTTDGIWS